MLAPLGWLGYVAWVAVRTGSVTGYYDVQNGWGNGFDGGLAFARLHRRTAHQAALRGRARAAARRRGADLARDSLCAAAPALLRPEQGPPACPRSSTGITENGARSKTKGALSGAGDTVSKAAQSVADAIRPSEEDEEEPRRRRPARKAAPRKSEESA
ncbi:hypothetical protein SANTM175S_07435 [Streptomyces antimycoticus]